MQSMGLVLPISAICNKVSPSRMCINRPAPQESDSASRKMCPIVWAESSSGKSTQGVHLLRSAQGKVWMPQADSVSCLQTTDISVARISAQEFLDPEKCFAAVI